MYLLGVKFTAVGKFMSILNPDAVLDVSPQGSRQLIDIINASVRQNAQAGGPGYLLGMWDTVYWLRDTSQGSKLLLEVHVGARTVLSKVPIKSLPPQAAAILNDVRALGYSVVENYDKPPNDPLKSAQT